MYQNLTLFLNLCWILLLCMYSWLLKSVSSNYVAPLINRYFSVSIVPICSLYRSLSMGKSLCLIRDHNIWHKKIRIWVLILSKLFWLPSLQFSSVAQSCLTLCDTMDCSMPGLPVHHLPVHHLPLGESFISLFVTEAEITVYKGQHLYPQCSSRVNYIHYLFKISFVGWWTFGLYPPFGFCA